MRTGTIDTPYTLYTLLCNECCESHKWSIFCLMCRRMMEWWKPQNIDAKTWLTGNYEIKRNDLVKYLNGVERIMLPESKDSDQWSYFVSADKSDEEKLWRRRYKLIFIQHPVSFNNKHRTAQRRLFYDDITRTDLFIELSFDIDSDLLMHRVNR